MIQVNKVGDKLYPYRVTHFSFSITDTKLRDYILKWQLRYGVRTPSKAVLERLRDCIRDEERQEKEAEYGP